MDNLSIKGFNSVDHTYSPQPDQYPFRGNIKKKSKFVFFRIYRLRKIFFARYTKKLQNYIHGNCFGCLYAGGT